MKKHYLILLFLLFFHAFAEAQLPTVGDCLGAIPICSTYYDEPDPYIWEGTGNYPDEILRSKECMIHELNGMWYTFTSLNDGLLRFVITPHDSLTDYDWNVFDITYGKCEDLKSNSEAYLISSNTFGAFQTTPEQSITGANSNFSDGSGNCNGPGVENGPAWNDDIPVYQDHIYLIYISNWSGSQFGYSIDFSESTADIWDRKPPELTEFQAKPVCGQTYLNILFSENVICENIKLEAFKIENSYGNEIQITSLESPICESGGTYAREFKLELNDQLLPDTYTLFYADTICDICNNKTISDSLVFTIDSLKIDIQKTDVDCAGNKNGKINLSANENDVFYSIDNVDFIANKTNYDNLNAGTYYISAKNKYFCESNKDTITINEPDSVKIELTKTDVTPCNQSNNGSIKVVATGGTTPYKYSLNNTNNFSLTSDFNSLMGGNYTLYVKDAKNCLLAESIEITAPEVIEVCLKEIKNLSCFEKNDGLLEVECTSNNQLLWSTGDTTARIENLSSGNYKLTVSNDLRCYYSVSYSITQPEKLNLEKKIENISCFGEATGSAELTISGGTPAYQSIWSNNATTNKISDLPFGEYWVKVEDANHCSLSDTFQITQAPELILSLSAEAASSTITPDGQIHINISGGTPYYETIVEAKNVRAPYDLYALYSDLYTLKITDANHCTVSDTISVLSLLIDSQLEVPNVFTPNNDGINDLFLLKAYGLKTFSGQIVNRWGRLVYTWDNPYEGWDGRVNNSSYASEGVYFYVIKAKGMDDKDYLLKGSFYLVR